MSASEPSSFEQRRKVVLIVAVCLLTICVWTYWRFEQTGTAKLVAGTSGRIGLVLAALWLAWPALRRPADWLPPGFAILGVGLLAVLAAQPRMIAVLLPAFSGLLALAWVVRAMRR
jgi:peptidoglycan/LPS O-acetylase OafA/YrhL